MSFQNGLSLVLCYLILMLPMSCRNRVESSGVANIDLESTQGFSGLDEEVQSHALALQRYLNAGLKQTGFQIFDMQDRMVSLKEYDEYKDVDKGRRFYFKLSKLKLENMGMQFFTKIDPVSEILEIKIQSIDVRTKNVISNSEQVLSFDTQKINKIFDKANTNQEIYNQLAGVREKIRVQALLL